jgi:Tetratricopeptide repeat/Cytochrome c554 and c-prime
MPSPRKRLSVALLIGLVLIVGIVIWTNRSRNVDQISENNERVEQPKLPELPEPARLTSPYLNTVQSVKYLGNDACTGCHTDQHDSYHLTDHSRALRKVDPKLEPPDTEYFHEPSGRWYKVYRAGDELRHRESVRDSAGNELVLQDKAVPWVLGSGHFSQSYLAEEDSFLIESPITWYAARAAWQMSPGFDTEHHQGFERLAPQGCVVCHAGEVQARNGNEFQPEIRQMSIGCENCHGPGSLHVEKFKHPDLQASHEDLTIVNPAHLSRELAESVCANCHLRGEATVFRRGREFNDFRPGFLLTDLRIDYGVRSSGGNMKVVGHVEQLRASRCYTQSGTLTCITCHDPHLRPADNERIAFFRNSCLKCHTEQSCGIEQSVRLQTDPADNCMRCHMPRTDTDIPHFAFTHHRIGIHSEKKLTARTASPGIDTLVPLIESATISAEESERALGLAYFEFAPKQPENYPNYLELSRKHLLAGEQDSEAAAALAGIGLELQSPDATTWAALALSDEQLSSHSKLNALVVRGVSHLNSRQPEQAVEDLRLLVQIRRNADYWHLLADSLLQADQPAEALQAMEQAVEIAPQRIDLRQQLLDLYTKQERLKDALKQHTAIEILNSHRN